jgi:hypothetical protein
MPKSLAYFQTYVGDYTKEVIASCSMGAQGCWYRMEMVMHASERYGYLQLLRKPMPDLFVARRIGIPLEEYLGYIEELESVGWIKREKKTLIIYSEALIEQELERAGGRERVREFRKRQKTEQEAIDYESITNEKAIDFKTDEKSSGVRKSLNPQEDCNAEGNDFVTSPTRAAAVDVEDDVEDEVLASPPENPKASAIREASHTVARTPIAPLRSSASRGNLKSPDCPVDGLVEQIAIASPPGVANGWTPVSLIGNMAVKAPIWDAISLESQDGRMSEADAGRMLLDLVQQLTAIVTGEPGWQRFWTTGRMQRFYRDTQYRGDLGQFKSGGRGDGDGKRSGKPGTRSAGNEAVLQRLLANGGLDFLEQRPEASGAGLGELPDRVERVAGPDPDGASHAGVRGGSVATESRGGDQGVQPSAGGVPVLPHAKPVARVRWPD